MSERNTLHTPPCNEKSPYRLPFSNFLTARQTLRRFSKCVTTVNHSFLLCWGFNPNRQAAVRTACVANITAVQKTKPKFLIHNISVSCCCCCCCWSNFTQQVHRDIISDDNELLLIMFKSTSLPSVLKRK